MLTESTEMYLQVIYRLTEKEPQASVGAIARALGFSLSTVSEKVKKLTADGLVRHEWREQVSLTRNGRQAALRTLRKRRLVETFLYRLAGYGIDELYEEACRLEHVISERMADALDRLLEHPGQDPHGHPIPTREGLLPRRELPRLSEVEEGVAVMVSQLRTADPELLKYAFSLGLIPGTHCSVVSKAPLDGPVRVNIGSEDVAIALSLATLVEVEEVRVKLAGER